MNIFSLKQYDYENYNTQTCNDKVTQKHFLKSGRKLCGSEKSAWKNNNIKEFCWCNLSVHFNRNELWQCLSTSCSYITVKLLVRESLSCSNHFRLIIAPTPFAKEVDQSSKDFYVVKWGKILELRGLKEWEGYFAMVGLKEFSHIHVWVCSIA